MAFFDNMDKKISMLSQGANKKIKDASDSVRISGAIKDEQNKQNEIYKEMGKYFYENYAEQATGQLKAYCDVITNSNNVIYQYQEQLKVIKGVTYCTKCNAEIPLNSAFCSSCGTPVVHTAPAQPTGPACSKCGAPIEVGQLFCVNCGHKLEQPAAEPEPAVAPEEIWTPEPEVVQEEMWTPEPEVVQEEVWTPEPEVVQEEVWTPEPEVVQEEVWTPESVAEIPAEPAWEEVNVGLTCPACGNKINPGQSFCTNCGTKCV